MLSEVRSHRVRRITGALLPVIIRSDDQWLQL